MNKISLEEAEEIARSATQKELEKYDIPQDLFDKIAITTLFEEDDRVFVLYVLGETRDKPLIIAKTRINLRSGGLHVEVPGWALK